MSYITTDRFYVYTWSERKEKGAQTYCSKQIVIKNE